MWFRQPLSFKGLIFFINLLDLLISLSDDNVIADTGPWILVKSASILIQHPASQGIVKCHREKNYDKYQCDLACPVDTFFAFAFHHEPFNASTASEVDPGAGGVYGEYEK